MSLSTMVNNPLTRLIAFHGTQVFGVQSAKSSQKFGISLRVQWHIPTVVPEPGQVAGDHGQTGRHRFQCGIRTSFTLSSVSEESALRPVIGPTASGQAALHLKIRPTASLKAFP